MAAPIFTQGAVIDLPGYAFTIKKLPICAKRSWSLGYAAFSGAFFSYHMIRLLSVKPYQYVMKMDLDIHMLYTFPVEHTFSELVVRQPVIAHTCVKEYQAC